MFWCPLTILFWAFKAMWLSLLWSNSQSPTTSVKLHIPLGVGSVHHSIKYPMGDCTILFSSPHFHGVLRSWFVAMSQLPCVTWVDKTRILFTPFKPTALFIYMKGPYSAYYRRPNLSPMTFDPTSIILQVFQAWCGEACLEAQCTGYGGRRNAVFWS